MKILSLEFSSPQRSVAVTQDQASAGPLAMGEAIETGARSSNSLGLVEEALRQRVELQDQIAKIATTVPGMTRVS